MIERYHAQLATSVGPISFAVDRDGRLLELAFAPLPADVPHNDAACERASRELTEYFAGERRAFDLELAPHGTSFQQRVRHALTAISYGQVASYGEIARRIGMPGAARAVGQANGRNPIPVVIPCHRVIAADGSIGGFSSGLEIKRALLAHEQIRLAA